MGGLLYSLNFFFCTGLRVVSFVPIYNITALIKMVGGWAGSGFGLGVGWAELLLKDFFCLGFCTFSNARAGLQCDGWKEDDDGSVFTDGVLGTVMKTR
jgi:hypothetical protein